ncbi:TPA: hypothetical protein U2D04_000206 [Streptococcus suis]|nr:hypothetical protein [Streptococcus suis]NQJ68716.1 hypothetical protein [Streptococcus suis]NQJ77049.1 hypothetical protein [Streptococcus suis]HEM6338644.1 hypothetical protein [Streptococcus suis]
MLVWSAKTAKRYQPYHYFKVMTTAQRESLCRAYKKYAIKAFKLAQKNVSFKFDGSPKIFRGRNVYHVNLGDFWNSEDFRNLAVSKKVVSWIIFKDDMEDICKKTIPLLRAAGYKAEFDGRYGLSMWKVK